MCGVGVLPGELWCVGWGCSRVSCGVWSGSILAPVDPCPQEGTLEDKIAAASQSHAPIPEAVLLTMFFSACEGLHALHCCQDPGPLAHRDVKVCVWEGLEGEVIGCDCLLCSQATS